MSIVGKERIARSLNLASTVHRPTTVTARIRVCNFPLLPKIPT